MDHPDLPNPQKASARRRLIRGALSAPALMTVCAGSAFAAASNLRCLANAAGATTPPAAWGTTGGDTYLRVQLYRVITCTTTAPSTVCVAQPALHYIRGNDLNMYVRGPGMPNNSQYLQIDPVSYVTIGLPVPNVVAPPTITSEGLVGQYVAIRFNSSGVIVGIGVPGSGGQGGMVGMSCWLSAFPRP